jgi:hypothetical protein
MRRRSATNITAKPSPIITNVDGSGTETEVGVTAGLTHHNSESGLAGKPCLLVKSKLLDHIFATFR